MCCLVFHPVDCIPMVIRWHDVSSRRMHWKKSFLSWENHWERCNWEVPPLFTLIEHLGQVERAEMYRAFNMGVGMVLVLSRKGALEARCVFPELITVGYIREGKGVLLEM